MLFNLLYVLALIVLAPALLVRMIRTGKYRRTLNARRGFIGRRARHPRRIWIHAVSVGEANVAQPLVEALRAAVPDCDAVVSTITPTGQDTAIRNFGRENVFYCPFDFSWMVSRVYDHIMPAAVVLMELELWPNLIREAARRGVPVIIANGRISNHTVGRYRRLSWLFRRTLRHVAAFCAQDAVFAERARAIGMPVERVVETGNIKFDAVTLRPDPKRSAALRRTLALADGTPVLVAGSTHASEERSVGEAYLKLRAAHGNLRLIVAPRHPERFAAAQADLKALGLKVIRLSAIEAAGEPPPADAVILVDKMGVLSSLYQIASVAFIGGSLIPHGGQNVMEPAGLGVVTVFGPHMFNFSEAVDSLLDKDAAVQIQTAFALPDVTAELLSDDARRQAMGRRARDVIRQARGAAARTAEVIARLLPRA